MHACSLRQNQLVGRRKTQVDTLRVKQTADCHQGVMCKQTRKRASLFKDGIVRLVQVKYSLQCEANQGF